NRPVPRLIWAPITLLDDPTRPDGAVRASGRDPLAVLQAFGTFREGDVVSGEGLEQFLQYLIGRCQGLRPIASRQQFPKDEHDWRVYVVGTKEDGAVVDDVTGHLIDDYNVAANASTFDGPDDEVRRLHEQEMREADAVLYCWGDATDTWVRSYTREVREL